MTVQLALWLSSIVLKILPTVKEDWDGFVQKSAQLGDEHKDALDRQI